MAIYTIHSRGPELDALRDAHFLQDKFSWGASWLGPVWLLRNGLYAACAGWVGAMIVLALAASTILTLETSIGVFLALQILLGLEADGLLGWKLERSGYRLVDIVAANNLGEAEVAFYRRHVAFGGLPPDREAQP